MALAQNLLSTLGSVAGTAGGTMLGGPIGGTIGGTLGSAAGSSLGSLFEPSQQQNQQPGQQQGSALFGSPATSRQISNLTPEQQNLISQLLPMLSQQFGQQQGGFAPIAQQAREQFQQQTVPGLAERFTALGARGSSGFAQALGQAGAGLESGLAAQEAQFGQQQQGQLMQLLSLLLQPQFTQVETSRDPGALESALPQILGHLAKASPDIIRLLQGA